MQTSSLILILVKESFSNNFVTEEGHDVLSDIRSIKSYLSADA